MAIMEEGRACIIKKGRDFGKIVMVLSVDKSFAEVKGPNVNKRKINVMHLWPLKEKVNSVEDLSSLR